MDETADCFPYILWVHAGKEAGIIETCAMYAVRLGLVDETVGFLQATKQLRDWFKSLGGYYPLATSCCEPPGDVCAC